MNKIPILIFLSLISLASCSKIALNPGVVASGKASPTPSPERSASPPTAKPLMVDRFKEVVYIGVLSYMYNNQDKAFDDINGSSYMIYRNETILPEGIKQIENNQLIPAELVQSLKDENDRIEEVPKYSGDEDLIKSFPGDRDLSKLFNQAKVKFTKFSGTQKVAAFSRIGVSVDHRKALVYTEYYSPKRKLIKCYFVMDIEMSEIYPEADFATNTWNVKMIPIN